MNRQKLIRHQNFSLDINIKKKLDIKSFFIYADSFRCGGGGVVVYMQHKNFYKSFLVIAYPNIKRKKNLK